MRSCLEQQSWKQNTVLTHCMNKGTRMKVPRYEDVTKLNSE